MIKRVYRADPLLCPRCGSEMKVISFIESCQPGVIESILKHVGIWDKLPARSPPQQPPTAAVRPAPTVICTTYEPDPDYLEHQRLDQSEILFQA